MNKSDKTASQKFAEVSEAYEVSGVSGDRMYNRFSVMIPNVKTTMPLVGPLQPVGFPVHRAVSLGISMRI